MRYERELIDALPDIRRYVRSRMGDRGTNWEDVYGGAVLAVWEMLQNGKYRGEAALKTVSISVANKMIQEYFRRGRRHAEVMNTYRSNIKLATYETYRPAVLPDYLGELVHRLPRKQRLAVLFRLYDDDKPLAEFARDFGVNPRTGWAWYHRAIDSMRRVVTTRPVEKKPELPAPKKTDELAIISPERREQLQWLIKMHNAYVCMCHNSPNMPGVETMIEDSTAAMREIAEILVCGGRTIDKLLDDMSDIDTISYLITHKSKEREQINYNVN